MNIVNRAHFCEGVRLILKIGGHDMKRIFILLLAVVLTFSLSACGNIGRRDNDGMISPVDNEEMISRDRAIELALDNAGVTLEEVRDLEAELDRERGGVFWEVDFESGGYEYSYDIDSKTGEVTKVERDFD